jgi:hypothetical protein
MTDDLFERRRGLLQPEKRLLGAKGRGVLISAFFTLLLLWGGQTVSAAERGEAAPFREGSFRFSVVIGSGTAFRETYSIIGAGLGYYIRDNVELGLDAESWQGAGPGISRLSPQVMYVVPAGAGFRPYAGVFFRRTFIEQQGDLNDAGGRAGALILYGRKAYIGAGVVYERHLGCDRHVYESCSDIYPELLIAVIF